LGINLLLVPGVKNNDWVLAEDGRWDKKGVLEKALKSHINQ